jgi:polysaccharide biosynthesis protein PslH
LPLRLLVLAPFSPRRDARHGGSRAIAQLLLALSQRHRLGVVYLRGGEEPALDAELAGRCELVREVPHQHPRGWRRRVRQVRNTLAPLAGTPSWVAWWAVPQYAEAVRAAWASWRPDVVHAHFHLMGQYLPALRGVAAPIVLVQHDPGVGAAAADRGGLDPRRVLAPFERRAWRRYEAAVMCAVEAVVVFTERDRALVAPLAGATPVVTIPLGTELPARPLDPIGAAPATLLFVGNFGHAPNLDAARRLAHGILPRVQARTPAVRLSLVGADGGDALRRLAGEHIDLAESVEDVVPYLDRAAVVVLPLRLGGGMRVKTLEALAAGKAVVASRVAVDGLAVTDGDQCCLADTDAEFAARIGELLADVARRRALAQRARAWAVEHLGWGPVTAAYESLHRGLLTP